MSTPWDISTATYDSLSKDLTGEDTSPTGFTLKKDGTKMYSGGAGSQLIYQYTLSTPFNISTASYDSVSKDVSSEDSVGPRSIVFKQDGTKLYMLGVLNKTVYQYSLSVSWDLSTASYDSVSHDVSTEDSLPLNVTFKPDGSLMFMIGDGNDKVYEYTVSNAWNLDGQTYGEGDKVIRANRMWRSRVGSNTGNDPETEAAFWQDMQITAEGLTIGKHFFVLGRKLNPNKATIELDLMEMPPGTIGAFSSAFSSAFDV